MAGSLPAGTQAPHIPPVRGLTMRRTVTMTSGQGWFLVVEVAVVALAALAILLRK